jgi:cold shock CspA family protein
MNRIAYALAFFLIMAWGCEHIAIMPRTDISGELNRRAGEGDRIARDRTDSSGGVRESTPPRDEITGTVERVDKTRREIHLRTTEGRMVTVKYDQDTAVFDRDREIRVEALNQGDSVAVRVNRGSRGDQHANVIRLNEQQDRFW